MKNNIRGLVAYVAYIFIAFFTLYGLLYANTFYTEWALSLPVRILAFVFLIAVQIFLGVIMSINEPKQQDFMTGIMVAAIAVILYVTAVLTTKGSLWETIPSGVDGWRFFKFYAMPGQVIGYCFTVASGFSPLYLLVTCFLPTICFGIGLKEKRKYLIRRQENAKAESKKEKIKTNRIFKK